MKCVNRKNLQIPWIEAGICVLNAEGLGAIKLTDEATTAVDTPEPGVGADEEPMATEASGTLILNLDQTHASGGSTVLELRF